MILFLDTNVLLDILMESRQNHLDSATILRMGEKGVAQIVISTRSIIDAAYVFTQKEKSSIKVFKESIRYILSIATIAAIDENNLKMAIRSNIADFEDAAQIDCATKAKCDFLISSDRKWKGYTALPVYTPKEFCDLVFEP